MEKFDVDELIKNLPAGLDRSILRILSFHVGCSNTIGRTALVAALRDHGYRVSERQARAQISQLRKAGHLICSAPGEDGGYYLPANDQEFDDFVRTEYLAKITDMQETLSAMKKAAEKQWGKYSPARQPSLFG
jgi:hypothetical protein